MIILIQLVQGFLSSIGALITQEAALTEASKLQTLLASSKVRLVQGGYVVSSGSTKTLMIAAEATYDGYTTGGNTITAWGNPLLQTGGGYGIAAETTFAYVDGMGHVANVISGGWVEDAAGDVIFGFNLPTPVTLNANGIGFILQLSSVVGRAI